MPSEAGLGFGDVILVPFPFTDQSASKRRPAVVISSVIYNAARPDIIFMAITSQLAASAAFGEIWLAEWQGAGLLKPSAIKPVIATLEAHLPIRRLGKLGKSDAQALHTLLREIMG